MMTRLFPLALSCAALAISGSLLAQSPSITATKSDGTAAATKKNPGDPVTYTNTITNGGAGNATGVTFTDPDVNGSAVQMATLKVSPIAFDDTYTGIIASGVPIDTTTSTNFSAITNDYVGIFNNAAGVLTVTAFDATSLNGGTVTMVTSGANMGKFTYVSAGGYTGPDSFTYTISNTGFSATGTVNLTVSGPAMFFVSTTGNDTTGKGTLAAPYATLTKVATVDFAGARIFVFSGAYTAGMTMETSEQIIGQGIVGVSFDAEVLGITPTLDSAARPSIGGTKPTITDTVAANVITLASGNTIRGVTINSTAAGYGVAGSAITSLQLGSAVAGTPAADTIVNSSAGSTGCLSLTGAATGTVNVTGQLSATAGRTVNISGRTGGTTSIIGKVTDSGAGVSLSGNTGATFNFRCLVLSTAANTAFSATGGGTLNITNGLTDGIDNDGDGTTDEADEANTIVTTSGTALNVANTTIGASRLTFRSIASNGSSSAIVLNTTGSNGLTVTGDGVTSGGFLVRNGTGGTIQNTTADAVSFTSASDIVLRQMNITNAGRDGVQSIGGGNITLSAVDINHPGNGNPAADGSSGNPAGFGGGNGWFAQNITGTNAINHNSRVFDWQASQSNAVLVLNTSTNFTSFTMDRGLVTTSATGGAGFHGNMNGTSGGVFTVTSSEFTLIDQNGLQIFNNGSGTVTGIVQTCNFHDADNTGGDGNNTLYMKNVGSGLLNFKVGGTVAEGNTFKNLARLIVLAGVIQIDAAGGDNTTPAGSSLNGFISNNNISNDAGFVNGRRAIDVQIEADNHSHGGHFVEIANNTINNIGKQGINILVTSVSASGLAHAANCNFRVLNNSVGVTLPVGTEGNVDSASAFEMETNFDTFTSGADIVINALVQGNTFVNSNTSGVGDTIDIANRGGAAGTTSTMNLTMLSNIVTNLNAAGKAFDVLCSGGDTGAGSFLNLDLNSDNTTPNNSTIGASTLGEFQIRQTLGTFGIENLSGGVAAFLSPRNNNDTVTVSGTQVAVGAVTNPTTPTAFLMLAPGGIEMAPVAELPVFAAASNPAQSDQIQPNPTKSNQFDAPAAPATVAPAALTQAELDAAVASAQERWIATGLTSAQIERLKSLSFEISALPGMHLGEAGGNVVRVSSHAGGNGWFMDASAASDTLFGTVTAETRRYTDPGSAPAGRIDLLTTLMHEMGHALGLSDSYNLRDRNSIMYGHLTTGERRYPAKDQAKGAAPFVGDSMHFLTGSISIGVLPPGKSVTISYDVIVNNPPTTATLSSQGTVSGTNFSNVLTDDLVTLGDPLLPGAADPTVTLIDLPDVSVTVAPSSSVEDSAVPLVYSFARTGDLSAPLTVNFAATGTATAGTDYAVSSGTGTVSFANGTGLGTITIPALSSTATAIVTPSADTAVEANETVIVSITSGLYDIVAPVSATGTITNDDTAVSIDALPDTSLFEDQVIDFSYTFRRTGLTTGTTVANFSVGGSAVFNTDYTQTGATTFTTTTGTVTFAPGVTTVVVTLNPTNDNAVEGNEDIVLTVTSGTGYLPTAPTFQTATIVDDDVNVSLTSVSPATTIEDSGLGMVYTFTRSGGSTSNALAVNVTISGTAGFIGDYTTSGFTSNNLAGVASITFAGGATTKTVTIFPISDVTSEPDETVILTVAANGTPAVTGGYTVGGTPSGTGTILNDDTLVSVTVAPTPVGEASGTGMVYTFSRTGATVATQAINFTKGGTATVTSDFSTASSDAGMNYAAGTVTFPIGSSTVTITLTPAEDALVEGSETAILTVAAGTGYAPSGPPATGTITDNDTATIGYVSATSTVAEATANDVQQLVLTITATGAGTPTLAYPVSVNVTGTGGTATSGTDYTPPTGVTFPANSLNADQVAANIAITNDRAVEGTETADLGLAINTDGTGGAVTIAVGAAATHTTTITDNDTATVSYSAATSSVAEGTANVALGLTPTVTGNGTGALVLERSTTFNITITGGTATGGGTDYTLPVAVVISAGTLDAAVTNFNLTVTNDQLVEGSETAILGLTLNSDNTGGQVSVGTGNAHTTTITDNDTANITFASPTSTVLESAGPDVMNLVLTIVGNGVGTAQLVQAVSVNVTNVGGGTATGGGVDFTVPALVTFPANSLSAATQPASLAINNDLIVEASETANLGLAILSDPSGQVTIGGANTHTTTITDNDTATISFAKVNDGAEGPPIVNGKFRITQTAQASTNTVVNYTASGTATPGAGNDYATLSGTATILAGNTTVDVDVIVQADVASEPTETVIITFSSFGAHDPDITLGAPSSASLDITSGPIPVSSALGDVVSDNPAPGSDGATNIGKFDLLRRSAFLGENGDLVFAGYLLVGAGPPVVTNNDFQGLWAKDAANPLRLIARSGSAAAGTGGAVFDILPEVPAISDGGDVTFYASLRVGTGAPATNGTNDTGLWTTLSVAGANPVPALAIREGGALPPPSSVVITKFATGAYATATTGATGALAFSATGSAGKSGVFVMTMVGGVPTAAATSALEGDPAPGAGGDIWDNLASGLTDPARMDANGNFCWAARVKPSHREGVWYAPIATGIAAKVAIAGDAAPGTTTTFSRFLYQPVMGGVNNIAFHAYVAATGDNTGNVRADGVWKGVAPAAISTYTLAIRCGDTATAGLPGGAKVGNMWSPWMSNGNHLALRAWVDIDGNGVSGVGTDVTGLFTDTDNTMRLVVKQGDTAPGIAGATFNYMDLPVIGGVEQMAFLGTVTGGGTTAANNQGIWRQAANGGALALIARTGDTVSTTQGVKTISKLDFPGTSQPAFTADHRWEQRVMDGTGRMVIQATFTDGTTSQLFTP